MQWFVRFLAAGSAVTISGMVAARLDARLGGMLLAFPFVIGTGLVFTAPAGTERFREILLGVLFGLFPLTVFALTTLAMLRVTSPWAALAAGVSGWIVCAGVLQWTR